MTFTSAQSPTIVAHRGASAEYPENTRSAILRALDVGADAVEVDAHLTAEGAVFIRNDHTVDSTSNDTGRIRDLPLSYLRHLDFASWKNVEIPEEYGPAGAQGVTLVDVLNILADADRDVELALELKSPRPFTTSGCADLTEAALSCLQQFGFSERSSRFPTRTGHHVKVQFISFEVEILEYLAYEVNMNPAHLTALFHEHPDKPRETMAVKLVDTGVCGRAGPGLSFVGAYPDRVKAWVKSGVGVGVWTVDSSLTMEWLVNDIGVDAITTNDPALALRVFGDTRKAGEHSAPRPMAMGSMAT